MPRIVAFGCSNTWGQGLPDKKKFEDNFKPPFDLRGSMYAWPSIVARKLGIDVVNKGRPGASNKEIWHQMVKFEYKPSDIVIVMWTFSQRFCILNDNILKLPTRLNPWRDDKESKFYYSYLYDEYDLDTETWLRIEHIDKFVREKVPKLIHLNCVKSLGKGPQWIDRPPSWASVEISIPDTFQHIYKNNPLTDCDHPGTRAHELFAEEVVKLL